MGSATAEFDSSHRIETVGEASDQQFLQRFVEVADEAAFAELVRRHGAMVWRVCRRVLGQPMDAEDVFQAVFLVLFRKAQSIRKTEAVGSWLYSIAYRTAMKARQRARRRHDREARATPAASEQAAVDEAAFRELQRFLDEEVQRLKEKYRGPFVLCCLNGLSKAEAARELGLNEGTVSSRLAEARKQLQARLARRGIALSAALTAAALAQAGAASAAPAVLAATGPAGNLSSSATNLADGVCRDMALARLKTTVALALTVPMLLVGATLAAFQFTPVSPDAKMPPDPETFVWPAVPFWAPIDEQILSLTFSPDGKKLVTAGAGQGKPGQLTIWDVDTGKNLATLRRIPSTRAVAFAHDGKTIATGELSGAIQLRDAQTGDARFLWNAHEAGVNSLVFSPDSSLLVSAGLDGTAKLWDLKATPPKELQAFRGHDGFILSTAFFGHGKAIVTAGQDKTARIWDSKTGKEIFKLEGHLSPIEAVAISRDDKTLATASWDQTIKLWDAQTGMLKGALEGSQASLLAVAFSPTDDKLLASAALDGSVLIWDVEAKTPLRKMDRHHGPVWSIAFAPDGKALASGSSDRTANLWDPLTTKKLNTFDTGSPPARPVQALAYAPDGEAVAMATDDNLVQIRSALTGDVLFVLPGHKAPVRCLAFSRDGQTLASGSADKTVKLWDRTTGKEKFSLEEHTGGVNALAFTANGAMLASAGEDGVIKWWDTARGTSLASRKAHPGAIHALALSRDDQRLASGGADIVIKVWNVDVKTWGTGNEALYTPLRGHKTAIRVLTFAVDGAMASGSADGIVRIWEPALPKERLAAQKHSDGVGALAFSPGGGTLVSAGLDGAVIVWDPQTGQTRATLHGHKAGVTALAMHPHGKHFLSGSFDTTVLRWNAAVSNLPPGTLIGNPTGTRFACFSPTSDHLASGGNSGTVMLWPRTSGIAEFPFRHPERTWYAHHQYVTCGVFLDNGARLATAGWDGKIKLWNLEKDEPIATLQGHKGGIRSIVALSDGKTLVSASEDATVKLWDLTTFKEKATLKGNAMVVYSMATSPDRKTLATAGGDHRRAGPGELILWDLETGKPRKTFAGVETIWGVAFSHDGTLLAGAFVKGEIKVWDVKTGDVRTTLSVPYCRPVAFSRDDKILAAGYGKAPFKTEPGKGGVRYWDTTSWKAKADLPGHEHVVLTLDYSPDGRLLATASEDGRIKFWPVPAGTAKGPPDAAKAEPNDALEQAVNGKGPGGAEDPGEGIADSPSSIWLIMLLPVEFLLASTIAFVLWLYRRRFRVAEGSLTVSFQCSDCGKNLKAKPAFAGKRLRCPHCRAAVLVPPSKSEQPSPVRSVRRARWVWLAASVFLAVPALSWIAWALVPAAGPKTEVAAEKPNTPAGKDGETPARQWNKRLVFDFRKKLDELPAVGLLGPEAESSLTTDANGLRVTLPAGRTDSRSVGLEVSGPIRGDFEIDLAYELIAIGPDIPVPGAGVQLRLIVDAPAPILALTRLRAPFPPRPAPVYGVVGHDGDNFGAFRINILPDGKEKGFSAGSRVRAREPKGRLKLARTGTKLKYLVSDGRAPFHLIKTDDVGADDVQAIRLLGFSGWGPVAVDVRFTEMIVQADSLPDGIDARLTLSKAWLAGGLVVAMASTLFVGVFLCGRRRKTAGQAAPVA